MHNGVPRTTRLRQLPRLSRWHRPYAAVLLILDCSAVALASLTAITRIEQAASGFQGQGRRFVAEELFPYAAYIGLPVLWLLILWGHGAYDRRYLGVGTDEYKRVFQAGITAAASISFVAFALKIDLSRLSVATALVGAMYRPRST